MPVVFLGYAYVNLYEIPCAILCEILCEIPCAILLFVSCFILRYNFLQVVDVVYFTNSFNVVLVYCLFIVCLLIDVVFVFIF